MESSITNLVIPNRFKNYEFKSVIGKGSFAVVAKCYDIYNKRFVAVKFVLRKSFSDELIFARFESELRIIERIDHPNIVKIYEVLYFPDFIGIVMEYCNNGVLYEYLASCGPLPDSETIKISSQLLSALAYLHERNIVHRDIKPENIALDDNNNIKLLDFGMAKEANDSCQTVCGSNFYAAPEIVQYKEYDAKAADMWSFGMVVHMMATGSLPYGNMPITRILEMLKKKEINLDFSKCGVVKELVERTVKINPFERATAKELLNVAELLKIENGVFPRFKNPPVCKKEIADKRFRNSLENKLLIRKTSKIVKPGLGIGPKREHSLHYITFK